MDTAKQAAERRADADCRRGFANLQAQIATTPEWTQTTHQGAGRPTWQPARAMLVGMRDHLAKSIGTT